MMVLIMRFPLLQAGVWTDDFDKQVLDKEWKFRDRREKARIQVRSATLLHSSSHAHLFEYDGWLLKA